MHCLTKKGKECDFGDLVGDTSSDTPSMHGWLGLGTSSSQRAKMERKKRCKCNFCTPAESCISVCAKPGFRSKFRVSIFILKEVPTTSIRDILSDAAAAGSVGPSFLGANLKAKFKHADHCLFQ